MNFSISKHYADYNNLDNAYFYRHFLLRKGVTAMRRLQPGLTDLSQ
jgi:hypothetical protein